MRTFAYSVYLSLLRYIALRPPPTNAHTLQHHYPRR